MFRAFGFRRVHGDVPSFKLGMQSKAFEIQRVPVDGPDFYLSIGI